MDSVVNAEQRTHSPGHFLFGAPRSCTSRRRLCTAALGCYSWRAYHHMMSTQTPPPQSPIELLERLMTIFPEYRAAHNSIHDDAPSFHSVLIAFSTFFGGPACSMSERQLRLFGELVSTAVESGGQLENAFATCFFEHAEQIGVRKMLRPFLSRTAIEKTNA
jgi:hypothetical protein